MMVHSVAAEMMSNGTQEVVVHDAGGAAADAAGTVNMGLRGCVDGIAQGATQSAESVENVATGHLYRTSSLAHDDNAAGSAYEAGAGGNATASAEYTEGTEQFATEQAAGRCAAGNADGNSASAATVTSAGKHAGDTPGLSTNTLQISGTGASRPLLSAAIEVFQPLSVATYDLMGYVQVI